MVSSTPLLFAAPWPQVVGHRGSPATHPENTPESFAAAHRAGAAWVELDARLTADGGVVVLHDPVLPDGRTLISLTTEQALSAGLSTLETIMDGLPVGLGVDLEVKNFPGEPDHDEDMAVVAACVRIIGRPKSQIIMSAFNPMVILAATDLGWSHPLALLTRRTEMRHATATAAELGCRGVFPHHDTPGLDSASIAAAHEAGLAVMAWTVDDPARQQALAAAGIDAMCTNDPASAVASLRRS